MNRYRKRNSNDDGDGGQSKCERQKRKLDEGMKSARRRKILTDADCSNSDDEVDFVFESRKKEQKMKQSYNNDDLPYIPESDNTNKMNKKGKQKKYGLDLKRTTCYRSNLRTMIKELNDLEFDDCHINEIRKTPFWFLFRAIYKCDVHKLMKRTEKHEETLREIMLAFDHNIDKFVVGRESISLTSRDVQLIFGVGSGLKYIPLRESKYEVVPWVRRCIRKDIERANGNFVLYKTIIYQRLQKVFERQDEISCVDAGRLTHSYLLVVQLAPNQNASIAPHLAGYLENLGTVCNYDWCTYIVDMLVHQIKETKTLKVGGCIILLAVSLIHNYLLY
ncbi:hypothetical protein ACS0TY_026738 [Phlomoides rotata]